jgi:hypothetical protein
MGCVEMYWGVAVEYGGVPPLPVRCPTLPRSIPQRPAEWSPAGTSGNNEEQLHLSMRNPSLLRHVSHTCTSIPLDLEYIPKNYVLAIGSMKG